MKKNCTSKFHFSLAAFFCLAGFFILMPLSTAQAQDEENLGSLAILDLVDLTSNRTLPTISHKLRLKLSGLKRWSFLSREEQAKIFRKYDKDPNTPCNDTQCGFELGSLLQSKFVLFGSASRFRNIGLLTLKLMNIQTAKIVWSKVMISKSGRAEMENTLYAVKHELSLATIDQTKKSQKVLAILDFSENTPQSKFLFECVITHAYRNSFYDIMSTTEVKELSSVLEIKPESLMKSVYSMAEIGKKLDVNGILFSQFNVKGVYYKHSMALYDVDEKSVVLTMPPIPQASFRDLILMEQNFFTGMNRIKTTQEASSAKTAPRRSIKR